MSQNFSFVFSHSPAYLPKPPDFPDQTRVVGYFWLPEKPFTPPEELVEFLAKGTPVYVGFGSVNVPGGKSLIVRLVEVCVCVCVFARARARAMCARVCGPCVCVCVCVSEVGWFL